MSNICGEQINRLRQKHGMAQVDLAEALNVDYDFKLAQSDISEIERRVRGLRDFELKAITEVLEVEIEALFSEAS
jgi:transcriptional regulator with XRE-family HTH domain